jgi:DNA adenine methylase
MIPHPIVKYAGGKTASVEHILRHLPEQIETYYEPFFGGGAVFFALAASKRFKRAVIGDACEELIVAHQAIRDDVDSVIDAIRRLGPSRVTEAKYYRIREAKPRTPATIAARFLFLNKTGFNGLYRVNRFGKFNAPWGKRTSWRPDYDNLRAVSEALCDVEIVATDFEVPLQRARHGDAVYLDPPYLPKSKTEKFTSYTRYGFTFEQQLRLSEVFGELVDMGVHVVASNADTPAAMRLYGDIPGTDYWRTHVSRAINSNGGGRGKVGELLIVNPARAGERR